MIKRRIAYVYLGLVALLCLGLFFGGFYGMGGWRAVAIAFGCCAFVGMMMWSIKALSDG